MKTKFNKFWHLSLIAFTLVKDGTNKIRNKQHKMKTTIKLIKETYKAGNQIAVKNSVELLLRKKSVIPISDNLNGKLKRTILITGNFQAIVNIMDYIDEVKPVVPIEPMPSIQPPVEPTEPPPPIPIQPPAPTPQIIPEPAEPGVPPIVPLPSAPPVPGPPIVPEVPFVPMTAYQIVV
jgi:hypothetical protein